ncbi:hypothetical protein FIBSPDRAFT_1053103 [Athelia psychrophila]|uniref:Uncharacterized protein n=1 Tax=Athelia psychrophila TaxID=1759441 RepID=A0A167XGR7_9AGAM|nr:hypothetical protein FIBSPDRAFT_1053103 [Fibularhizoctonia sp. CBS 109695]
MSQSQALAIIPIDGALVLDRVVQNGPGMHLNLAFSAGGVYVEAAARKCAELFKSGPVPATKAVESFLEDDDKRLAILDELFVLRGCSTAEHSIPSTGTRNAPKPSKAVLNLKKMCGNVLKYARSSELSETQLSAFKGIVMLTTGYIGIRSLFMELLPSKKGTPLWAPSDLARSWRQDSPDEKEYNFFLDYAAYCVTGPDEITVIVESLKPSSLGYFADSLCVSERLSN